MARGRFISKTLGSSRRFTALGRHFGGLGEFAQALYPLLVAHADDYGRQAGDAFTVKHAVFPTSPRTEPEFEAALAAMAHVDLVLRYDVRGRQVLQIVDFDEHQKLSRKVPSKFGDPSTENSCLREENRTQSEAEHNTNETALRARFDRWWESYPRKIAKDAAWREWLQRSPDDVLTDSMIDAVERHKASPQWRKDGGQFIPHPRTWLHQGRWQDELDAAVGFTAPDADWFDECQQIHAGECGLDRMRHHMRKQREALSV